VQVVHTDLPSNDFASLFKTLHDDPESYLGVMHYDRDRAPAFVFDMMEPERPKVDNAVLAFLKSEALHPADFTIREDGVVRLNPELARRVAGLAVAPAETCR
jgi:CRISP-associated protein Cas1